MILLYFHEFFLLFLILNKRPQKGVKSFMKLPQLELYWLNSGDLWKIVCFMACDDPTVFSQVFSLFFIDSTQKGSKAWWNCQNLNYTGNLVIRGKLFHVKWQWSCSIFTSFYLSLFSLAGSHPLCQWPSDGYKTSGTISTIQSLWG